MASADQLKALLKSHFNGDDGHFYAVAMQLAAHEAKLGHGKLAEELRSMIDVGKAQSSPVSNGKRPTPIMQPRGEMTTLLDASYPKARLAEIVLDKTTEEHLQRIIGILHLPVYTLCNSWLYKVLKTGFFRCTNEHKPSVHCTLKVYIHAISQSR